MVTCSSGLSLHINRWFVSLREVHFQVRFRTVGTFDSVCDKQTLAARRLVEDLEHDHNRTVECFECQEAGGMVAEGPKG